jgi:hypothetical protein
MQAERQGLRSKRERERRSPQRKRARISQIGMGSVVRERLERSTDQARSRS